MLEMKRVISCTKSEARLYDVPFEILVQYQVYYLKNRYSVYTDDDRPDFEKFLEKLPDEQAKKVRFVECMEHNTSITSRKLDSAVYYNHVNPDIPEHYERLTKRVFIRP